MTYNLKAFNYLQSLGNQNVEVDIDKIEKYTENELKLAFELIERLDENLAKIIQEKLIDFYYERQNSWEDGDLVFPSGSSYPVEYFGFKTRKYEPSDEEEEFFETQNKIYQLI